MAGLNASELIYEWNNKAEHITGLNKEEKVGHAHAHAHARVLVRHVYVYVYVCVCVRVCGFSPACVWIFARPTLDLARLI